jgi:excisionase family DNA binding protein
MDKHMDQQGLSTPLLVRVEEAARILSLGRSKIYELLGSGELSSVKCGKARRIPLTALVQWVDNHSIPKIDMAQE